MSSREICKVAIERGLIKCSGKTPEATMASALYTDVKRKHHAVFTRPAEGLFGLKEWSEEGKQARGVESLTSPPPRRLGSDPWAPVTPVPSSYRRVPATRARWAAGACHGASSIGAVSDQGRAFVFGAGLHGSSGPGGGGGHAWERQEGEPDAARAGPARRPARRQGGRQGRGPQAAA